MNTPAWKNLSAVLESGVIAGAGSYGAYSLITGPASRLGSAQLGCLVLVAVAALTMTLRGFHRLVQHTTPTVTWSDWPAVVLMLAGGCYFLTSGVGLFGEDRIFGTIRLAGGVAGVLAGVLTVRTALRRIHFPASCPDPSRGA